MAVEFDDVITISFAEWCNGEVLRTSIKEIARDSGIYNEGVKYIPIAMRIGGRTFPKGLYDELIGKEAGAKGTVVLPPDKAYGERSKEKIQKIHKKNFEEVPEVGEIVSNPDDGDGVVVGKIGPHIIVDFNHALAGKEVRFEYEIHKIVKDPAEQLSHMLEHLMACEYESSFEDGNGIISVKLPTEAIFDWNLEKVPFIAKLFERHPSLDTLELREEYENIFHTRVLDKDNVTESEQIQVGDVIVFHFIERCDGKVSCTSIEEVAIENDIYDEDSEYAPDVYTIGGPFAQELLDNELIGKEIGAKGTLMKPPEEAYGLRSDENIHSVSRKEISRGAKVGSHVHHHEYGDGIVVSKIGKRFVVDFNHVFAGKDIEFEYEILKKITDPAEQFSFMLNHFDLNDCSASFENGKGILNLELPLEAANMWGLLKTALTVELFKSLPSLETLEFREKYSVEDREELIYFLQD